MYEGIATFLAILVIYLIERSTASQKRKQNIIDVLLKSIQIRGSSELRNMIKKSPIGDSIEVNSGLDRIQKKQEPRVPIKRKIAEGALGLLPVVSRFRKINGLWQ